jgi:RimJ/RimL family protein N-acetyltransferase
MQLLSRPLEGRYVRLEPITPAHEEALKASIDCDPEAWEIMSVNGCGEGFETFWAQTLGETQRGERIGYAIRRKSDGKVVGTTSFLAIRPLHGGVEIGATFLNPDARSGLVNPETKLLRNARSQAAVTKLGAQKEGVLRHHKITWTGHVRDTVVFSIINTEWPAVKARLEFRLTETVA